MSLSRMRANYWTAKQTLRSRFGKKEDDHLVASDAELDSKLAVFYSLKDTCDGMILCIENYQDSICGKCQIPLRLGTVGSLRFSFVLNFVRVSGNLGSRDLQNYHKRRIHWDDS